MKTKTGKWFENFLCKRKYTYGQQTHGKVFTITNHKKNIKQSENEILLNTQWNTTFKKTDLEQLKLIHYWQMCTMI